MARTEIIRASDDEDRFAELRALPEFSSAYGSPVFGAFGRKYYPSAMETPPVELSFAVTLDGKSRAIVDCDLCDGALGRFGFPLQTWFSMGLEGRDRGAVVAAIFGHLDMLRKVHEPEAMHIEDTAFGDHITESGKAALDRGAQPTVRVKALVNLELDESAIRRCVRKSYRSLLNWGRKNLRLEYVNAASPDEKLFDRMREFHRKVAGNETRSAESWRLQFEQVSAGGGEVALAFGQSGELFSAAMVIDGPRDAVYFSGVYDRGQFDKPLAHWPLFDAILRSKARGCRRFVLGDVPLDSSVSAKERNIGYFKRGFATHLEPCLVWEWRKQWGE